MTLNTAQRKSNYIWIFPLLFVTYSICVPQKKKKKRNRIPEWKYRDFKYYPENRIELSFPVFRAHGYAHLKGSGLT